MIDDRMLSRYLDDLPAIYRQEDQGDLPDFLGRFLLAFEHVLTGVGDRDRPGLEELLDGIVVGHDDVPKVLLAGAHRYFTPGPSATSFERAPAEFLEWLSSWVALTLRDDWDENERRRIIAQIVHSYGKRGTPEGLRQILAAFANVRSRDVTLFELQQPFQIGPDLVVGESTVLGDGPPHQFIVRVPLSRTKDLWLKRVALRALIDMEKPAHTVYDLWLLTPTIQIGFTSTLGENTLLGVLSQDPQGLNGSAL